MMSDDDFPITATAEGWRRYGWPDGAKGVAALKSLERAQRTFQGFADELLSPYDLNLSQYEVLLLLHFSNELPLSLGQISRRLQLSPPAVTKIADKLERDGWAQRRAVIDDRRRTIFVITRSGKKRVTDASATLNAEIFAATQLSPNELLSLTDLTRNLSRNLHRRQRELRLDEQ
jgi:DNA-binding MarR family transcriptional regulator